MRSFIVLLLLLVAQTVHVCGQTGKKCARLYNAAIKLHAAKQYDKACKKMKQAIKAEPKYDETYSLLGQWYFEQQKFQQAADIFRQASLKCRNGANRFARALARSYVFSGQADNALAIINAHNNTITSDSTDWRRLREQALFVRQAMMERQPCTPQNLGVRINTKYPELFPSMSADTSKLYFTRKVNNMDEDLFTSDADSCGGWFTAQNFGAPPNTADPEYAQFVSADGHYVFFTRCDNRTYDGWAEGGCDLFMAYRVANDSPWTQPQPFGATINTLSFEGMPSLSADNRELYFVSDRAGGFGGYDIWISRFENGLWQLPVNAGPSINTPGNETAPYINIDNRTLYFTSDGRPGMGGTDLYVSRKITDNTWDPAKNLGYPINTAYNEQSCFVSGQELYFSSDRQGPPGNFDIYSVPMPNTLQPIPVGYLQGYVYDSVTKDRLSSASMYICDVMKGDTLYQFQSNRGDASYVITLPVGHTYAIHTGHQGFMEADDTLAFAPKNAKEPIYQHVPMLPLGFFDLKPIKDTLIASICFDVYKTELTDTDKAIIRDAMAPWSQEKSILVYINAYTDNSGTPMINEELSAKRAVTVSKYVMTTGYDETNVLAKGWGEANAIAPNDTEENRRKNRRVEIIIKR